MSTAARTPIGVEHALRLLHASLDGIASFDRAFRFQSWNEQMERIYGIPGDEAVGRVAFDVLPFLTETGEDACFQRALAGEHIVSGGRRYEVAETSRDGFADITYKPLHDEEGAIAGGIMIVRDVTEQKLAEERSKETESRFFRMADSSPVLLWMSGTDGLCTFFNQTWLTFTGRSLEQELGVGWAEGVHPFDFQLCMETYLEAFNARRPFEMEYRLRRADGEFRWILDRGTPRYNPDNTFAGFIGSCIDITQRKTLERALQDALSKAESASRLKSEFLANISHELRTPLNAIINVPLATLRDFPTYAVWECPACGNAFKRIEAASDDERSDACPDCKVDMSLTRRPFYVGDSRKTVHFLQRMVQSSRHLLKVVNDILDFAKIDAGRLRLFLAEVNAADMLEEVQLTMAPLAEEKQITIVFPDACEPLFLMADGVKVVQILINLVANAIKFTPAGGSITVDVAEGTIDGDESVQFTVRDTGVGIPPDKLDAIFESFRQAEGGHTRAHQGTGLGLSITKQLVELHHGRIRVESRVGEGSTFRVDLPKGTRRQPATTPPAGAEARRPKVMVIDDDPADLDLARHVLEAAGFDVSLLDSSEAAAEAVERERPDCIILDIVMPDLSGLSLLRRFKESDATSATPVLVTTAYHNNHDVVQRLGGVWVPKPWSSESLVAKVRDHVGQELRRREMLAAGGSRS